MTDTAAPDPHDIRPVIPRSGGGSAAIWAFGIALLLGGYLLFTGLADRRAALTAPQTSPVGATTGAGLIASPPPLAVPGDYQGALYDRRYPVLVRRLPDPGPPAARPAATSRSVAPTRRPSANPPPLAPAQPWYQPAPPRDLAPSGDYAVQREPVAQPAPALPADRIQAGRLASPALTVPQGAVIQAVLETAIDSTRPGAVRALVQRHVTGFDGTRVLIPRGSRLYGEYEADLGAGQKRAAVRWTRLLRPDGVTIALDSPASDPLGRAGIKGKVDSKFLQRFGGALLQSVLDVGVGLAASRATDGVIVALPGSTQNVQGVGQQQAKPTLTVRQGTSVSVFVARDLDFSTVDQ